MKTDIKISPYGNMLVYEKGYSKKFIEDAILLNNLDGLRIFDHLDPLNSLEFLSEYTFLQKLDIDCIYDQNYEFLSSLTNLLDLAIGTSVKFENIVDLSALVKLERLAINWRKGKIRGLDEITQLKILAVEEFTEENFNRFRSLIELEILQVKTASVKTTEGLADLKNLENLLFGNCRSLRSVKDVADKPKLKELTFDGCAKVGNFDSLKDLPELESLSISNCKQIDSIGFVKDLPSLKKLALLESTDVADGDLTPAKDIPDVYYKHREHYNIKIVNPEHEARIKRNLAKLKEFAKHIKNKD